MDVPENSVELGQVEVVSEETLKGKEILDQYIEVLKKRAQDKVIACYNCGRTSEQLVKVYKHEKNSPYICRICLPLIR